MAHDAFGLCALRLLVRPCASSRFRVNRRRPMPAGDVYHPIRAQRGLDLHSDLSRPALINFRTPRP